MFNDVVPVTPIFSSSTDPLANMNWVPSAPRPVGIPVAELLETGPGDPQPPFARQGKFRMPELIKFTLG